MKNKRRRTGRIKHNPTGKTFDEVSYQANDEACHYKMQPKPESLAEGETVFGGHFIDRKLHHAEIFHKNHRKLKKKGKIKDTKILLSEIEHPKKGFVRPPIRLEVIGAYSDRE